MDSDRTCMRKCAQFLRSLPSEALWLCLYKARQYKEPKKSNVALLKPVADISAAFEKMIMRDMKRRMPCHKNPWNTRGAPARKKSSGKMRAAAALIKV